ncbi:hypothetical protein [Streptomyces sp. NBC_00996]|uniref:hypothetical protein n=1 Tax=Streptomyces sp. NBC_00996 TaxID=2903710 RepID=UPI00386335DC|nr:hypothetical protein OG390_03305 [Streptomyces sp. NBC_00996]
MTEPMADAPGRRNARSHRRGDEPIQPGRLCGKPVQARRGPLCNGHDGPVDLADSGLAERGPPSTECPGLARRDCGIDKVLP